MIDNFDGEYKFLSNFYYSQIYVDGILYPTVEHAYQSKKTNDSLAKEIIRNAKTPGSAKRFGRMVTLVENWDNIKLSIMEELLRKKFSIPELSRKLLSTGADELVEGNSWGDTYWGICNGIGENNLGKLLMKIREDLYYEEW